MTLVCSLLNLMVAINTPFAPLDRCVPADVMAVYFGRPSPEMLDAPPGGTADNVASWLITLKGMGVIPRDGRLAADIIGTVPILWRRPHAVMLLDATSEQVRPRVYRLERMQAALVVNSRGIELAIERRIRDLLATYTDVEHGKINTRGVDGITVNRLIDSRLDPWAVIEWGQLGEHFIVGFGEGAFDRVIGVLKGRTPNLADHAWFKNAHRRVMGSQSGVEIYLDVLRVRERLEPGAKDRPAAVLDALQISGAEKLVWTTGYDERAVRSLVLGRMADGRDHFLTLAGREIAAPQVAAAIPAAASSYFVLRLPLGQAVRNIRQAYMESQSPGQRRAVHELWTWLQNQYGFDSETDVLDQLGDHFVVHTWPPHPLRLAMLCTIWVQIGGDTRRVSRAVDRMMQAWQDALNNDDPAVAPLAPRRAMAASRAATRPANSRSAAAPPAPKRSTFSLAPRVRHEPDGLWTCQLGLINPALVVTKNWIVISWSPDAVRANLKHLGETAATHPSDN